jgi:hypothetical protein
MDKKCVAGNAQSADDAGDPQTAMILLLLVLFLVLLVAGGLVVLSVARRAPQGCEDGTGFHLIRTLSGKETLPDLGLDPAHENCGVGHVEAEAAAEPARTPDLELPFGVF